MEHHYNIEIGKKYYVSDGNKPKPTDPKPAPMPEPKIFNGTIL